jgi:hypothetical protein
VVIYCWTVGVLVILFQYGVVLYDAGSKVNAKLDSALKDEDWFWPPSRLEVLVAIQSKLDLVERSVEDRNLFHCKNLGSSWHRRKVVEVKLRKLVWFSFSIPRHPFYIVACK